MIARAKRGRVVEDEVEKVNRRHGPADIATQKHRCELDARVLKSLLQNRSFLTKKRDFEAHLLFESRPFLTKKLDFEAHSLFESRPFLTKKRCFQGHSLLESRSFLTKKRCSPGHSLLERRVAAS